MFGFFVYAFVIISAGQISLPPGDFENVELSDASLLIGEDISINNLLDTSTQALFRPLEPEKELKEGWIHFTLSNSVSVPRKVYLEVTNTVYFDQIELFKQEAQSLKSLGITGDPVHHSRRPT